MSLDPTALPLNELIGLVAALLTTLSFLPQALLTLRTRDVSGISLSMYSAFTLGVGLWLVYGVMLGAWPVIIANALIVLCGVSYALKKEYWKDVWKH